MFAALLSCGHYTGFNKLYLSKHFHFSKSVYLLYLRAECCLTSYSSMHWCGHQEHWFPVSPPKLSDSEKTTGEQLELYSAISTACREFKHRLLLLSDVQTVALVSLGTPGQERGWSSP